MINHQQIRGLSIERILTKWNDENGLFFKNDNQPLEAGLREGECCGMLTEGSPTFAQFWAYLETRREIWNRIILTTNLPTAWHELSFCSNSDVQTIDTQITFSRCIIDHVFFRVCTIL